MKYLRVGLLCTVFMVTAAASCDDGPDGVCPEQAAMDDIIATETQEVGALRTELLQLRGDKAKTPCPDCSGGACGCAWATVEKCAKQPPKNPTCCRTCCCDEAEKKEAKPVPPPKPVDPISLYKCKEQIDFAGDDLKKLEGLSKPACAKACTSDAKCGAFVHDEGTTCWLKEAREFDENTWWLGKTFGAKRTSCLALDEPLAFFECIEDVDFPGNDLVKVTGVTDIKDCASTCKSNAECTALTYDSDETCWMKKGSDLVQSSWWLGKLISDRTSCTRK